MVAVIVGGRNDITGFASGTVGVGTFSSSNSGIVGVVLFSPSDMSLILRHSV